MHKRIRGVADPQAAADLEITHYACVAKMMSTGMH